MRTYPKTMNAALAIENYLDEGDVAAAHAVAREFFPGMDPLDVLDLLAAQDAAYFEQNYE